MNNWETAEVIRILKADLISYQSPRSAEDIKEYATSGEAPEALRASFAKNHGTWARVDWQAVANSLKQ